MNALSVLARQDVTLQLPDFTPEFTIWLDWETFYDAEYTLRKLSTSDYIRDPRFEAIGVGVDDGEECVWMEPEEFREWAKTVPWERCAVGCHHTHFDGLILSHHFNIHPGFMFCTMSMARTFGIDGGVSLATLAEHFQVGHKGHEVDNAKGKRRKDFTLEEWLRYGEYCKTDTRLAKGIFDKMIDQGFPEPELYLIDLTVKMFTKPVLRLDEPLLKQYRVEELERKAGLLARIGMDKKAIGANETLAQAFRLLDVEPPRKWSEKQEKEIYAFAKSDPGMQELLEHEVDEVRWLAEARISVKSTIEQTRTERFLSMGANGASMPVYLNYAKAHTFRWAGGDKRNFQNLGRVDKKKPKSGMLKKSLLAEEGKVIARADSGAIEARVTAWLAGHEELIEGFRQKRDIYSELASEVYQRHVDRKRKPEEPGYNVADEGAGNLGKVACFAADTLVLTDRGWVLIVEVELTDRLWDGVEWVCHQGLVDQGVRETWTSHSVTATPDHEILTGHGWRAWSEVLTDHSLFQSALSSASSPSSDGNSIRTNGAGLRGGDQSFAVHVGGKVGSIEAICSMEKRRGVTGARRSRQTPSGSGSIVKRFLMMLTACGFSIVGLLALLVATIRRTLATGTTAVEGSLFARAGGLTPLSSSGSLSRFQVGTSQNWSSIGSTTTGAMNLGTSGLSLGKRTSPTGATSGLCRHASSILKQKTRVYDLLSVGSRRRFTVKSDRGPLLVHNCLGLGFQMGWPKFATTLLAGPMGNPPITLTESDADAMGVDVNKFANDSYKMERLDSLVSRLNREALVVHCAVSDRVVKKYRDANKPIVDLWETLGQVIETMADCGENEEFTFGPNECLTVVRHGIRLPNGLTLHYPGLRESEDSGYSYLGQYGKIRQKIYGGLLTENLAQALARIVVGEQVLSLKAKYGYEPKLLTHDEIATVVDEAEGPLAERRLVHEMTIAPSWARGLPLAAEGGFHRSLGHAK